MPGADRRFGIDRLAFTAVFISLEGLDGVGKTTLARRLAARLRAAGREVVECREPGGTALGERVRPLILAHGDWAVGPRAEALLYAAARAQIVEEVIRPALGRGAWVVSDRFVDSSLAYQGAGRELGVDAVAEVNAFATSGLLPARTVLLDGVERRDAEPDRIESAGEGFRTRVAEAFRVLAQADPARVRRVDARGSEDEVAERVWRAVHDGGAP